MLWGWAALAEQTREDAAFAEDGLSREDPRWRYGLLLICALDVAVWALVIWVALL